MMVGVTVNVPAAETSTVTVVMHDPLRVTDEPGTNDEPAIWVEPPEVDDTNTIAHW
jgi:hypothetical protein